MGKAAARVRQCLHAGRQARGAGKSNDNCNGKSNDNDNDKSNNRSLRPSGFTPAFGRAVAPSARSFLAGLKPRPSGFWGMAIVCGGKDGNGKGKGNNNGNCNRRKASLRQSGSAFGAAFIGRAEALPFRF